jgi:streptogramin lyase
MKVLMILCGVLAAAATSMTARDQEPPLHASDILATLPDGATKRQYILDCTGCHQLHPAVAWPGGKLRSEADWRTAVTRMLGYAGPNTGFPVISAHAVPDSLARFLATHLPERSAVKPAPRPASNADIREFMMPVAGDLPHDVAIDASGSVIITGMFSHRMYVLDGNAGTLTEVEIPVERSSPRAVEIAPNGEWWVLLGGSKQVGAYDPKGRSWRTFDIGVYPHSIALDSSGGAWYNGHFTRDPSLIGRIDRSSGDVQPIDAPLHPVLAKQPGGPIPYEVRAARDGAIWISELQGNRVLRYRPREQKFDTYAMPTSSSGPRRLDVDASGVVWIPLYSAGKLARLDPVNASIREIDLPIKDSAPYVVRVDNARNRVWIGTGAADVIFEMDLRTEKFITHPLPTPGAMVRHLAVDAKSGDLWIAYGASPGIAARVARLKR